MGKVMINLFIFFLSLILSTEVAFSGNSSTTQVPTQFLHIIHTPSNTHNLQLLSNGHPHQAQHLFQLALHRIKNYRIQPEDHGARHLYAIYFPEQGICILLLHKLHFWAAKEIKLGGIRDKRPFDYYHLIAFHTENPTFASIENARLAFEKIYGSVISVKMDDVIYRAMVTANPPQMLEHLKAEAMKNDFAADLKSIALTRPLARFSIPDQDLATGRRNFDSNVTHTIRTVQAKPSGGYGAYTNPVAFQGNGDNASDPPSDSKTISGESLYKGSAFEIRGAFDRDTSIAHYILEAHLNLGFPNQNVYSSGAPHPYVHEITIHHPGVSTVSAEAAKHIFSSIYGENIIQGVASTLQRTLHTTSREKMSELLRKMVMTEDFLPPLLPVRFRIGDRGFGGRDWSESALNKELLAAFDRIEFPMDSQPDPRPLSSADLARINALIHRPNSAEDFTPQEFNEARELVARFERDTGQRNQNLRSKIYFTELGNKPDDQIPSDQLNKANAAKQSLEDYAFAPSHTKGKTRIEWATDELFRLSNGSHEFPDSGVLLAQFREALESTILALRNGDRVWKHTSDQEISTAWARFDYLVKGRLVTQRHLAQLEQVLQGTEVAAKSGEIIHLLKLTHDYLSHDLNIARYGLNDSAGIEYDFLDSLLKMQKHIRSLETPPAPATLPETSERIPATRPEATPTSSHAWYKRPAVITPMGLGTIALGAATYYGVKHMKKAQSQHSASTAK